MAETYTTNIDLRKREKGDANWHTPLNTNADMLDVFIGQAGGDPNVELFPASFIGQRFFQTNAVAWWVATTIGTPPTGVWAREIPRGLISAFSGTTPPPGWALADGTTVTIDTVALVLPDLRGRFIVGYKSTDTDYDAIGKTGGSPDHVVEEENIEQFDTTPVQVWAGGGQTLVAGGALANATTSASLTDVLIGQVGADPIDHRPPFYVEAWIVKL